MRWIVRAADGTGMLGEVETCENLPEAIESVEGMAQSWAQRCGLPFLKPMWVQLENGVLEAYTIGYESEFEKTPTINKYQIFFDSEYDDM